MRHMTVAMTTCALLVGVASAADPQTDAPANADQTPDATVNLTGGSIAAGIGYVWGSGDLKFQGQTYKFKVSGVSVIDVGAAHINANGNVYNLKSLEDFSGNYTTMAAGLTIAGGGSAAVLRNSHGVVIKLTATTQGLRFNFSADGITIKLKSTG